MSEKKRKEKKRMFWFGERRKCGDECNGMEWNMDLLFTVFQLLIFFN